MSEDPMDIDRFRHDDIDDFLALAAAEGWICDRWEFEFLLEQFPSGCLMAREGGEPVGYVTAIKYASSGWVGNLIVRGSCRGKGIGNSLMENALGALAAEGTETVWLTASKMGKPIYEKLGFAAVDVVNRWVGRGLWNASAERTAASRNDILAIDFAGWGDRRDAVIDAALRRGSLFCADGAFLVIQPCGDGIQVGPWGGDSVCSARLLDEVLLEAGKGARMVLDVPIRNTGQTALLMTKGFSIRGSTLLMYRGKVPAYAPEFICALASMGSMG